jgi:Domain of Unknown Function (DUF1259)
MKRTQSLLTCGLIAASLSLALGLQPGQAQTANPDWRAVETVLGQPGEFKPGWIFRVTIPRKNVRVVINSDILKPALAQNTYASFQNLGNDQAIVNGDIVVTERELRVVTLELQRQGLQQTSTSRHLPNATAQLFWLHFTGRGPTLTLAKAVRAVLEKTNARLPVIRTPAVLAVPKGSKPVPVALPVVVPPSLPDLDTRGINQTLGANGVINGGVIAYSFARNDRVIWNNFELSPELGIASQIAMQPTGFGKAVAAGDLVLTAAEVNPVSRALTEAGVEVVEVNHELLDESPRLFHLHFFAQDNALTLARVLRGALDKTNSKR